MILPQLALAELLQGHVTGVTDGDTISFLDQNRQLYKVRLAGIDAPEKKQAFGQRSKEMLSNLVFDKEIAVEYTKKDRYGRIVGKLIAKNGLDINLEQVKYGMAWHYKKYEKEQSPRDRDLYANAEDGARSKHLGLWSIASPTPPWDFRKSKRELGE